MRTKKKLLVLILIMSVSSVSGCATVRPNRTQKVDPKVRVQQLEEEVRQRDAEINALKDQIAQNATGYSSQPSYSDYGNSSRQKSGGIVSSSLSGVSVKSIQKALKSAGFYAGSMDGQAGPRTKDAVRAFQRAQGLKADGMVGRKTWAVLSRYL